jgi:hypothetical protein
VDVVFVRIENHGTQAVYLSGGVSFDRDDIGDKHFLVARDALGNWPTKKALAPGDGFDVAITVSDMSEHAPHIKHFFFQDELRRVFQTDEVETRAAIKATQTP